SQSFPRPADERLAIPGTQTGYDDTIYRALDDAFAHTAADGQISFYGRNLEAVSNESWGIDNVTVYLGTPGVATPVRLAIDRTGPRVAATNPTGRFEATSLSSLDVIFNEAIDATSFAIEDAVLTVPGGAVVQPTSVVRLDDLTYRLAFPAQTALGDYTLAVGPEIADLAGNVMDQDGDGTGGEAAEDMFTGVLTMQVTGPYVIAMTPAVRTNNPALTSIVLTVNEAV
ncbi:MAG TPA: Ig-like domain-containing protein, partial [Lentisphaeria bacterium]|nr:Ig-like domain-containing protein [Lentisphaeria bacterium]